jgi:hypothetical protein
MLVSVAILPRKIKIEKWIVESSFTNAIDPALERISHVKVSAVN